jgi:leader peptidase (prepilin peptidase)/N-methyltransferase
VRWLAARRSGEPGLGLGDVKLLAALALWLGLATPWLIAAASLLGLLLMAITRPKDGRLAFGPAIAVSAWTIGIIGEAGQWPMMM